MPIDDCEIRIAFEDEDLRKYRAYLPQAFLSSPAPLFFLAENVEDGSVLGVGSLRVLREKKDRVGRFQLYVLPEQRRKGVGKQLMQAMSDHTAKQLGVKHLLAGVPVSEGSEDELFFQALPEFKIGRTLYEFVMDTEVAWDYLNPLVQRLSKKGGLPEGYEIVPLQQADPRRVYDFVLKYLGGIPDSLRQRLGGGKGGFLPKLSLVVRTVEGPAAVLLVRKIPKGLLVDSRVVGAKYRGELGECGPDASIRSGGAGYGGERGLF